jgi:membrane-associated phospholipid phosphatase
MSRSCFVVIFALLATSAFAQNFDINLLKEINLGRSAATDRFFTTITNSVTPLTIAVPAGFITYAIIKKDSTSKSNAIMLTGALVVSGIVTTSIKYAVHRERPFSTYPDIEQKVPASGYSFPSSHTSTAFALATSVSIAYPKWYVITPSFLWAGAVGYSRMELGVHYPSDVLAGALIGSGSSYLSYRLTQWINKKDRRLAKH